MDPDHPGEAGRENTQRRVHAAKVSLQSLWLVCLLDICAARGQRWLAKPQGVTCQDPSARAVVPVTGGHQVTLFSAAQASHFLPGLTTLGCFTESSTLSIPLHVEKVSRLAAAVGVCLRQRTAHAFVLEVERSSRHPISRQRRHKAAAGHRQDLAVPSRSGYVRRTHPPRRHQVDPGGPANSQSRPAFIRSANA
jgi:hypothetical protein